jgi:chitinase
MRKFLWVLAVILISTASHAQNRVVAYVPNWIDLEKFVPTIEFEKLTHINIAFENPVNDEGEMSFHKKNTVLIQKAREKGVKVLISIGGGAASGDKKLLARYNALIAGPKRAQFAARLGDYVVEHGFDGLDVDIEGPGINRDYGPLIAELGRVMRGKGKLLTSALSKGYGGERVPDSVFAHFDFVNIMAYDGAGSWNPNAPGQHSSMEFAKENVAWWLKRGLSRDKAVLGVPFYGYGFGEAFRKSSYSYAEILAAHPGSENVDEVGKTIWYNGIPTIKAKARYAVDEKLGGVMIWSLDNDVKGERSLLSALHEAMKEPAPAK